MPKKYIPPIKKYSTKSANFYNNCNKIYEVLEDGPLGFNALLAELKKRHTKAPNRTTFSDVLNYLVYDGSVNKKQLKGRGRPVEYSLNEKSYNKDYKMSISKSIENFENVVESGIFDSGLFTYENAQYTAICQHLGMILTNLFLRLYEYGHTSQKSKADIVFDTFLNTQLMPHISQIRLLSDGMSADTLLALSGEYDSMLRRRTTSLDTNYKRGNPDLTDLEKVTNLQLYRKHTDTLFPQYWDLKEKEKKAGID